MSDDGAGLLSSAAVGDLLAAAVDHAGGTLRSWLLDHIDANPQSSTTATVPARMALMQAVSGAVAEFHGR